MKHRVAAAVLAASMVVSAVPGAIAEELQEMPAVQEAWEAEEVPEIPPDPEPTDETQEETIPAETTPAEPAEETVTEPAAAPDAARDGLDVPDETLATGSCGNGVTWEVLRYGTNLATLYIGGSGRMDDYTADNTPWSSWKGTISSVVLADGVANVGSNVFAGCTNLTSVTLPVSVTELGSGAFQGCSGLTGLSLPAGLTAIGANAFAGCDSLTNMTIPEQVTAIPAGCFRDCADLRTVTIAAGVTAIAGDAFAGCSLQDVYYLGSEDQWQAIAGSSGVNAAAVHCAGAVNGTCGRNVSWQLESDGTLYILGSGEMSSYAGTADNGTAPWFGVRSQIRKVIFDDGITSIGSAAFAGCSALRMVLLPGSLTAIGAGAFASCTGLQELYLPACVREIGDAAFSDCTSLQSLTIPRGVTAIGESVCQGCTSLTAVSIPETVTQIGAFAFSGCSSLTAVQIPGAVTVLAANTFQMCTALADVSLPETLVTIEERAFADCRSLTAISLPVSVTGIGAGAFAGCGALRDVYYGGTAARWQAVEISTEEDGNRCLTQAAIHYTDTAPTLDLVNNQCIRFTLSEAGTLRASDVQVSTQAGAQVTIAGMTAVTDRQYQLTFPDPLAAGTYQLRIGSGSEAITAEFRISLSLQVVRVVDQRNVIIRLNEPIYGCTTAQNYFFHTLAGQTVNITAAASAFEELGGTMTNVFRLTTDNDLTAGTTYVVETKAMSLDAAGSQPCQGTIAYFTPTSFSSVTVLALTNNQSIDLQLPAGITGKLEKNNYIVKNARGQQMTVGNVQDLGTDRVTLNFAAPLETGTYTLTSRNMTPELDGEFEITLHLRVVRVERSSVIIQLSAPVYGCTEAWSYFVHKLGSSQEITAVKAESVFTELGGTTPNVFRVTLPEELAVGQTYILETRRMALDAAWTQPCQGTIGYFTPEADEGTVVDSGSCGASVTWKLFSTGKLRIEGTGVMSSYQQTSGTSTITSPWFSHAGDITSVEVCDGVTAIGNLDFMSLTKLTSVTLPTTLRTVGRFAFAGCTGLTSITIPEGTATISYAAFSDCTALQTIRLPATLQTIEGFVFSKCAALTGVVIPEGVTKIDNSTFQNCTKLASVTIPSTVKTIGTYAFSKCTSLRSVVIPSGVTLIPEAAFNSCTSLTSVTLPDTLTKIDKFAFSGCNKLTSIEIPEGVTIIGENAFQTCSSLTSVTIPRSVTTIARRAFFGCTRLTDVYYRGTAAQWNAIDISSANSTTVNGNLNLINAARHYI